MKIKTNKFADFMLKRKISLRVISKTSKLISEIESVARLKRACRSPVMWSVCVVSTCNNFIMQINIMIYARDVRFEVYQATKSIMKTRISVEFITGRKFALLSKTRIFDGSASSEKINPDECHLTSTTSSIAITLEIKFS